MHRPTPRVPPKVARPSLPVGREGSLVRRGLVLRHGEAGLVGRLRFQRLGAEPAAAPGLQEARGGASDGAGSRLAELGVPMKPLTCSPRSRVCN